MRIVHLHDELRPLGGVEVYLHALARAQLAAGHEVAVVHGGGGDPPAGVRDVRLNGGGALAAIAAADPDVLHVHRSPLSADDDERAGSTWPAVRSLHDYRFGCASGHRYLGDGRICERVHGAGCLVGVVGRGCAHRRDPRPALLELRRVGRRLEAIRSAAATVAYSDFVRSVALASGVRPERCRVLPYFVERPEERPGEAGGRTVAFVGRLSRGKGLDVLLEALASIPEAWDELLVAGDGPERTRCEQAAQHAGIAPKVRFLGWQDAAGVRRVLRRARLLALPSRWPEPFGIAGLEAMAAARPVVASSAGGIPDWLADGETGMLVPPGDAAALADAIGGLLSDPARARSLGERGWEAAVRFSPQRHLAGLDETYAAAAGGNGEA